MWKTKWANKRKGDYEPARKGFVTIILRVPNVFLTNFELGLRHLMREFDKEYGELAGKSRINILGERRLKPRDYASE